ncbi:phenylalanine--tRNA ligase subunit beta [Candidatus Poribacteria bacterium]|nr:MAG: phenylalanine--tRNA ligase subunit beta [Candidatus Poribacteria bacterium]
MKVSLNWLKTYIDFDLSTTELADRLTMLGIEVESIAELGTGLDGVVVGKVNSIRPHPNADKLVLCMVDIDDTDELQIVCGAPNVSEGMFAPVATIDTKLPTGITIKSAKLRGEESHGMLCSEKELGISDEASGLMALSNDLPLGKSFTEALGLDDVIFELEITPNRPDCLSMIGVCREIRAVTGNPLRLPDILLEENDIDINMKTSVTIDAPDLCSRYAARLIQGVKIGESPEWLKKRLESIGIGVINNIVDATNFVMMEYGQPLHAFDYNKLAENRIVVRRASDGEKLTTLDEEERELTPDMLVIADADKPVALAGVMGGYDSEITESTSDVLLESANFSASSIRSTSKKLGIHTEASYRFEREADPEGVITALDRATQLIVEIAGGSTCKGIVDVYPGKSEPLQIKLRAERVNFILGTELDTPEIDRILINLGFDVIQHEDNIFQVTLPSYRPDITREIDLIEEIARVYGYDNIPTSLPKGDIPVPIPDNATVMYSRIKRFLLGAGMMESVNYSFSHPNCFDKIQVSEDNPLRKAYELQNPLSPEMSILRTTLIPSLLENAQHNHNHQIDSIALFEISTVFAQDSEPLRVAGVITGEIGGGVYGNPYKAPDFFDVKGIVEGIMEVCNISDYTLLKTEDPTFHPGRNVAVIIDENRVGILGEVHPKVQENYELPYKAYLFELDLEALADAVDFNIQFEPIPIYPSIQRDLAILVDQRLPSDTPIDLIYSSGGELVESVRLFDVYEGDQVPDDKKSLAYTITYNSDTETLTDIAVNDLHDKIVNRLNEELGAELRM